MYPCDENEQDRLDLFHRVLCVARKEILHSPNVKIPPSIMRNPTSIHDQGPRILDLGCGTGTETPSISSFFPLSFFFFPFFSYFVTHFEIRNACGQCTLFGIGLFQLSSISVSYYTNPVVIFLRHIPV